MSFDGMWIVTLWILLLVIVINCNLYWY